MATVDKSKRKAAASTCFVLLGLCDVLAHGLRQVAAAHPPSGSGLGAGLTASERAYVANLATQFHEHAVTLRKLGWRFNGKKA